MQNQSRRRPRFMTGLGLSLILILGMMVLVYLNFRTVVVSGESMLPTFQSGTKVWVCKAYWLVGPIKHKDVVVIATEKPDEYIIKRVYKMAGEQVDWYNEPKTWSLKQGPYKVPDGMVYVLGDNREVSEDSRAFGPVEANRIIGKVVIRP